MLNNQLACDSYFKYIKNKAISPFSPRWTVIWTVKYCRVISLPKKLKNCIAQYVNTQIKTKRMLKIFTFSSSYWSLLLYALFFNWCLIGAMCILIYWVEIADSRTYAFSFSFPFELASMTFCAGFLWIRVVGSYMLLLNRTNYIDWLISLLFHFVYAVCYSLRLKMSCFFSLKRCNDETRI